VRFRYRLAMPNAGVLVGAVTGGGYGDGSVSQCITVPVGTGVMVLSTG
jgi:hypothetical protein